MLKIINKIYNLSHGNRGSNPLAPTRNILLNHTLLSRNQSIAKCNVRVKNTSFIILLLLFLSACSGDTGNSYPPNKTDGQWYLTPESKTVYIPSTVARQGLYFEDRTVTVDVNETIKILLDEGIDNWLSNNPTFRSRVQRINYVLYDHWYFPAYDWPWSTGAYDCNNTVYLAIYNKWEGYDYPTGVNLAPFTIENLMDSTEHILKWYGGWIPNNGVMAPALSHELDHVAGRGTKGDSCD